MKGILASCLNVHKVCGLACAHQKLPAKKACFNKAHAWAQCVALAVEESGSAEAGGTRRACWRR